jgi:hypothetical protein
MQQQHQEHDDLQTGHDLPNADGQVADEDVLGQSDAMETAESGQDHSLENHSQTMPEDGVGAIQDSSLPLKSMADIDNER